MLDLETITPAELEIKLHQLAHSANKAEADWNAAQEEYQILKDMEDSKFAAVVEAQLAKTTAEKERLALLDPEWGEWFKVLQLARGKANSLKVEWHSQDRLYWTCQSILSSKNKEWARQ